MPKIISKFEEDVAATWETILNGVMIAIDPASGGSSLPGFAIFANGKFVESGVIRLPQTASIDLRMKLLFETLQRDFTRPDVLVIEDIPPMMSRRGGASFSTKGTIHLHYACGVILGGLGNGKVVRCTPMSWQSWQRKHWKGSYKKTDENDARMIGECAIWHAHVCEVLTGVIEDESGKDDTDNDLVSSKQKTKTTTKRHTPKRRRKLA